MSTAAKPRLLIVDDEPLVCRSLAKAFRRNVDVSTAESASQARTLLSTYPFDVVLSDFNMPGENGVELLTSVANQFPLVRRVLMTDEPTGLQTELDDGTIHARLNKPFDIDHAAQVLGLTAMRLAALGALSGAFVSSLDDLPLVQLVVQLAPSEAELRALMSWQQQLLDTGLRHAVLLIIEPSAGLSVSKVASAPKWLAPLRAQSSSVRTGVAVVTASRLERMAVGAASVMTPTWPIRAFSHEALTEAVRWLRSTLQSLS